MARRVIHELIDDIDGDLADESVSFGLDGVQYSIDLSAKHAGELRDALAPFVGAATKIGRTPPAAAPTRVGDRTGRVRPVLSARAEREQNRAIREWAMSKGIEVSDRGRIRSDLVERYHAEAGQ